MKDQKRWKEYAIKHIWESRKLFNIREGKSPLRLKNLKKKNTKQLKDILQELTKELEKLLGVTE